MGLISFSGYALLESVQLAKGTSKRCWHCYSTECGGVMRRDFGLHYAAWFLVGTPFLLVAGLHLKATGRWFGPEVTGFAVFVYTFLTILSVSLLCALIDVFLIGTIVERIKNR